MGYSEVADLLELVELVWIVAILVADFVVVGKEVKFDNCSKKYD